MTNQGEFSEEVLKAINTPVQFYEWRSAGGEIQIREQVMADTQVKGEEMVKVLII